VPQRPLFDLEKIDPDAIRRVGTVLRQAGYTERGVTDRLGLKDLCELRLAAYPYYLQRKLRNRTPLDLGIALFTLQEEVTEEEISQLFDAAARRVLRDAKILVGDRHSRTWRSSVDICPVGDTHLFATDHRHSHHESWLSARVPREPVMYIGADSYYLARATIRKPVRSALDLCTGSGVHAILASGDAERVVGTDVNPRAINFSRLNAMLNDSWNAVFLEGDLFASVGKERFDLIVANPPFVPSPVYEFAYRDGGPSGADVLRRIVAGLPDHLERGGMAHIVTHIAERDGERYLDRLRRWLGGANMHLHSTRIGEEEILDYAISQTKRAFGESFPRYSERLMHWVTNMRSQRFKRVLGVVLTLSWNAEAPHAPWTQEDEAKPPHASFARELSRLFKAKKRARSLEPSDLDGLRVSVPDYLVLTERRRPTGKGFETKDYRVVFKRTLLSPELDIKPLVRDLLERVDNRSTVPELIRRHAEETDQVLEDIEERCRRAILVMFERGLIALDPVGGSKPPADPAGDSLESSSQEEEPGHGTVVERPIKPSPREATRGERERPRTIIEQDSTEEEEEEAKAKAKEKAQEKEKARRRRDTPLEED
jgi:methylase of polypeptide subunit release factors